MARAPCCDKANVKKGPWSPDEDAKLKAHIEKYGTGSNWTSLPHKIGLKRCGKSCRLRWLNYLRPNIKRGNFTEEEDSIICSLYVSIGGRWSVIAAQLPGRTDNDIKNYWNTKLKKKLLGRREQGNARGCPGMNIGADGLQDDSSYQSELSESALERLQSHMKLQSPQNPLSNFNDNPALWPELLHPLLRAEKMIQSLQLQQQQTLGHNLNLHAPRLECCDSTTGSRIENEVDVGYYLPAVTSTGADLQHDSPKVLPRNVESGAYSDTAYDGSGSLAFGPVISISPCSSDSIPMNYRGNITGSNTDKLLDVQNNMAEFEKTVISRAGGIMPQDEKPSDGLDYFEASSGSKDSMVRWSGDIQIESGFGQSTPWHTTSLIHHQGVF